MNYHRYVKKKKTKRRRNTSKKNVSRKKYTYRKKGGNTVKFTIEPSSLLPKVKNIANVELTGFRMDIDEILKKMIDSIKIESKVEKNKPFFQKKIVIKT